MKSKTAILLFSREAHIEARHKRFSQASSFYQNRRIAEQLIAHTQQAVKGSGLPVLQITQRGTSFGERLYHAFLDGFAQGYDRIIAIGNDCPTLTVGYLKEACVLLQQKELVLGPAVDGGVNLIGLTQRGLSQLPFVQLPWNTSHLFEQLLSAAIFQELSCAELSVLADIDDAFDLQFFLQVEGRTTSLTAAIQAILYSKQSPNFYTNDISGHSISLFSYSRPPPAFSIV